VFKPVNRYILIGLPKTPSEDVESLIILPEEYKTQDEERFIEVQTLAHAADIRFDLSIGTNLVVDRSMIEEISIGGTIYNVILDNYVVGMIE
jgi:hypothetical protein